jgi:murein DD-endopeptidase MepM/ murein hydrolase activator NlpD
MKIFGKQITDWSFRPKVFVVVWLIGGLFSIVAHSEIPLWQDQFDLAQSLFIVRNDFTRKTLLEAKLPKHIVQSGETLYRISMNYFVPLANLQSINLIANPLLLQVGRVLYIPPIDQAALFLQKYQVQPGDSVDSLTNRYNLMAWQFQRLNPKITHLGVGTEVILPLVSIKKLENDENVQLSLIKPVRGFLSSRFGFRWGRMHYGLDLAAPSGTPVKAADTGRISFVGWRGGYGLLIIIDHGQYYTFYGHLSKTLVTQGTMIHQGDIIGQVGATGHAYGSHLHFEVERKGIKLNPYYLIKRMN